MEKEKAKKAAELAEKELQEEEEKKQVELIKKAIKQTLEAIREKEKKRNKLNKEIKTLKQDIDNIRAGRLDLIAERQEKDEEAKRTSIIEVQKVKEIHHHYYYNWWYEPYKVIVKEPYYWNQYYTDCVNIDDSGVDTFCTDITCSMVKDVSVGTYKLENGSCVTLT